MGDFALIIFKLDSNLNSENKSNIKECLKPQVSRTRTLEFLWYWTRPKPHCIEPREGDGDGDGEGES